MFFSEVFIVRELRIVRMQVLILRALAEALDFWPLARKCWGFACGRHDSAAG